LAVLDCDAYNPSRNFNTSSLPRKGVKHGLASLTVVGIQNGRTTTTNKGIRMAVSNNVRYNTSIHGKKIRERGMTG
jgi:hypothetical protein